MFEGENITPMESNHISYKGHMHYMKFTTTIIMSFMKTAHPFLYCVNFNGGPLFVCVSCELGILLTAFIMWFLLYIKPKKKMNILEFPFKPILFKIHYMLYPFSIINTLVVINYAFAKLSSAL